MSITAAPGANRAVELFVLSLNTLLASTPQRPAERKGVRLAMKRQAEDKKRMKAWHKSAEKARKNTPASRQVLRAQARTAAKSKLRVVKKQAMLDKCVGGSATLTQI